MTQISTVYILLNRDFSSDSAEGSKQRILQMKANGRTYASQLASDVETITHVAGDIPFAEPVHVLACLAIDRIVPQGRAVANDLLEHATFGWFEFDDGLKGAIAAYFGPRPPWMQSARRGAQPAPSLPEQAAAPTELVPGSETVRPDLKNLGDEMAPHLKAAKIAALGILSGTVALLYLVFGSDKQRLIQSVGKLEPTFDLLAVALVPIGILGLRQWFTVRRRLREVVKKHVNHEKPL